MIKLVFAGDLITGFDRPQVVGQLAKLLKRDEAQIQRMLFSGKPVVVKRVATDEEAYKWRKAFAGAGAVLMVSAGTEEPAGDSASPTPESQALQGRERADEAATQSDMTLAESLEENSADTNDSAVTGAYAEEPTLASEASRSPGIRRRNKVYVLLGALVLVAIVLLVFVLWLTRPLWQGAQLDEQQARWAAALASPDTYALAHIDVARAVTLEALAGDEADLPTVGKSGDGIWPSLERAGIDLREQVSHAWLAGVSSAKHSGGVLLLTGSFAPPSIKSWMTEQYQVVREQDDGLLFQQVSENTCEPGQTLRAVIAEDRVLVGDPASIEQLLMRFEQKSPASQKLDRWRQVSANQLASLAVFAPENVGAAASGMTGMMLRGIGAAAQPAEGVFIDLEPVAVPPGVELRTQVFSQDKEFINASYQAFAERIKEWREDAEKNWPEVASLYDRLEVTQSDDSVGATMFFDRHLQRDMSNWVSSVFSGMFSTSGEPPAEERLETSPPVFANVAAAQPKSYADYSEFNNHFAPVAEAGPFGIPVESLSLTDEQQLALALKVQGYNLPNAPTRGAAATVNVVSVNNAQGESLLPAVECGTDKNLEPADVGSSMSATAFIDGEQVPYTTTSGSKELVLKAGSKVADIAVLEGYIDYRQATSVATVALQQPLGGKVLERDGVRIRFMDAGKHSLQYRVSGDVDKLLHVYAMNKDGKPLSSGSSMWGAAFFGEGQSASVDYHGEIASIKVVLATALEQKRYPFRVSSVWPVSNGTLFGAKTFPEASVAEVKRALNEAEPPSVSYDWNKPQLETTAGPATLAFQRLDFDGSFGLGVDLGVYLSNQVPLVGPLGAGAVRLIDVQGADSTPQLLDKTSFFAFAHDGGYWMNGEYQPDDEKPWIKGDVTIRDRELKLSALSALRGELLLNVAEAIQIESLDFDVGAVWEDETLRVQVTKMTVGELMLSYQGEVNRLVAVRALQGDELVSDPAKMRNWFGEEAIALSIKGQPDTLELQVADSVVSERYPFALDLAEFAQR
ncbi:hypothetical protein [uncultured Gilvimarinus sp.]|uniref:hypothetical protein n=1 Tax=uncultured Gilvimarinus sp. TaxID=1689143 RepID=UPI0030ED2358